MTIYTAGEDTIAGAVACLAADGRVVRATTANLAASQSVLGVFASTVAANAPVDVLDRGVAPAALTGLPAGAASLVGVDPASGACVREATPAYLVGVCDAGGDTTVAVAAPLAEAAAPLFNARAFGARGDGAHDDAPAINAAIAAMSSPAPPARGNTLELPPGRYRLASPIRCTRGMILRGASGGGGGGGTVLAPDAHVTAVVVEHQGTALDGGQGPFSSIRDLDIDCSASPVLPIVARSTAYAVGARARRVEEARYHYECIRAGTTAATAPASGAWPVTPEESAPWRAGTAYAPGWCVRKADAIPDRFWMCVTPGVSGATEPAWPTTPGATATDGTVTWQCVDAFGYFVTDGDAVWACRVAAGVFLRARAEVRNVWVYRAPNFGVHIQGSGFAKPPTNCNGWRLALVRAMQCGGGVAVVGADANAGLGECVDVESGGWTQPGTREGHGVYDASFLGNTWVAPQVATCSPEAGRGSGRGVVAGDGAASKSLVLGLYTENTGDPLQFSRIAWPAMVVPGALGGQLTPDSTAVRVDAALGCYGLWERDKASSKGLIAGLSQQDGYTLHPMRATTHDGPSQSWGWAYEPPGSTATERCFVLRWGAQNARGALAVSCAGSPEGPGNWKDLRGHFRGQAATYLLCVDAWAWADNAVRGGQRLVGDRYEPRDGVTRAGALYVGERVMVAGWRGPPWAPNVYRYASGAPYGIFPATCEPLAAPTGYAYRCVVAGYSGATEPAWPTTVGATVVDGGATWQCVGPLPVTAPYGRVEP